LHSIHRGRTLVSIDLFPFAIAAEREQTQNFIKKWKVDWDI